MRFTQTISVTTRLGWGILLSTKIPSGVNQFGTPVSEERVWECFEKDLDTAISECHALYTESVFDDFPEEVQQIVVNMMFNMGRTRLSKFKKFTGALIAGDWKEAAVEGRDSRWHKQVTNRAERLMKRLEAL